jgi:hypothetical protein
MVHSIRIRSCHSRNDSTPRMNFDFPAHSSAVGTERKRGLVSSRSTLTPAVWTPVLTGSPRDSGKGFAYHRASTARSHYCTPAAPPDPDAIRGWRV